MTNAVEGLEQKAGGNFKKRFCLCFPNTKDYFEIEAWNNHRCNDDKSANSPFRVECNELKKSKR